MHHRILKTLSIFRYRWARIAAVSSIVLLFFGVGVRNLGMWLIAADKPPPRLDLICTFAGEAVRVKYSKGLMLRYPSAHWMLSDFKDGYGLKLQRTDFDMSRVTVVDTCKNTFSEMSVSKQVADSLLAARGSVSSGNKKEKLNVGLVSSPYHMRRIRIMAHHRLRDKNIRYYCLSVPLDKYKWNTHSYRYWWRSREITSLVFSETAKIAYFILTGYQ